MSDQKQKQKSSSSESIVRRPPIPSEFVDYVHSMAGIAGDQIWRIMCDCKNDSQRHDYTTTDHYRELKVIAQSTHILTTVPYTEMFHKPGEAQSNRVCFERYWKFLGVNGVSDEIKNMMIGEYENFKAAVSEKSRIRADRRKEIAETVRGIGHAV